MPCNASSNVGKRIGRVGDDEQERFGRGGDDRGNDVAVDCGVGAEQPQSARGIASIRGAARFFIRAGGDHDHRRAAQVGVVARPQATVGASTLPYCRSATAPSARLRLRLTRTISRAEPRNAIANMHAVPTAPAPTIPTFIRSS